MSIILISYYRPQRSWAKVIFLQASVCPQGGGVSASVHAGIPPQSRHPRREQTPPEQTPPREQTPLPREDPPRADTPPEQTPPGPDPPPGSRLQHTVNERPVRILLECILVRYVGPVSDLMTLLSVQLIAEPVIDYRSVK